MNRFAIIDLLFFLAVPQAWSQDLDSLKQRAVGLWAARLKKSNTAAERYVEQKSRGNFPMYEKVRAAKVTELHFTETPSTVLVSAKTDMVVETVGLVKDTVITEPWVWVNGAWYLRVEVAKPEDVLSSPRSTASPPTYEFQFLDKQLNLGRHKQGEIVKGSIRFVASKAQTQQVRGRGISGLRVERIQWRDDEKGGTIDFSIDTSLLTEDVTKELTFDAIGPTAGFSNLIVTEKASVTLQMEGAVRLVQTSEPFDIRRNSIIQVEIHNLGSKPIQLEKIRSQSPTLSVPLDLPQTIAPGAALKLTVTYTAQANVLGTEELLFGFSAGVVPTNSIIFPLRVAVPDSPTAPEVFNALPPDIQQAIREAERKNSSLKD
jgi:hypothetical protein